jgi:hypothetical protein
MQQSEFGAWYWRVARASAAGKIRHVGRRALTSAKSVARRVLVESKRIALGVRRRLFVPSHVAQPELPPPETKAYLPADPPHSNESIECQSGYLSTGRSDVRQRGSFSEQAESRPNLRGQALEILCAAGALKACSLHGSHFLGSGDLAAAHRLVTERLSKSRDPAFIYDSAAIREMINPVFEEAARIYRCESCFGELKTRLTAR